MRKHVSTGRLMGSNIVLRPASSGNADALIVERIEVGPALKKSRVGKLHGRPYPVQFRNQGAFDAWKQALGSGQEWTRWADPEATCWSIRQEIQQQLNDMRAGKHGSMEAEAQAQVDARMQAISISANLKCELHGDGNKWTLELIFISQRQDCFSGHVSLLGDTERDDKPLGEWLNRVLDTAKGRSIETFYKPMYAAVSYVVKVFLYMALRQARSIEHREYDEAVRRIAGLGVKKRTRLLQPSHAVITLLGTGLSTSSTYLSKVSFVV